MPSHICNIGLSHAAFRTSDVLRFASIPIMSNEECDACMTKYVEPKWKVDITAGMMCAGVCDDAQSDACQVSYQSTPADFSEWNLHMNKTIQNAHNKVLTDALAWLHLQLESQLLASRPACECIVQKLHNQYSLFDVKPAKIATVYQYLTIAVCYRETREDLWRSRMTPGVSSWWG